MITKYDKQPIENATVSLFDDNGVQSLIIEPHEGYKLRTVGDNTYSTMQVGFSAELESLLENYIAVPIDEADEVVEIVQNEPSDDEEISDAEAISIIVGGAENDES